MGKIKLKEISWFFVLTVMLAGAFMMMPKSVEAAEEGVAIDETNFPDEVFRGYVKSNIDGNTGTDKDGILSEEEIAAVTEIDVSKPIISDLPEESKISTLDGIEIFKNLKKLSCSGNKISALNLENNQELLDLSCWSNQIINLNVNENTKLKKLECSGNLIIKLDVSNNLKLEYLGCSANNLSSLDIKNNTELTGLDCSENQLNVIDLSNNVKLISLNCSYNQLDNLDLSKNINLISIDCSMNQIKTLDLKNNQELTTLWCNHNKLVLLDVSNSSNLEEVYCDNNSLNLLDISNNKNIKKIECNNNLLSYLSIYNNNQLEELYCDNNLLEFLDVGAVNLLLLHCDNNQLTSLDITGSEYFGGLYCSGQQKTVKVSSRKQFDLSTLPGNFDVSRAGNWQGGTVQGNVLTFIDDTVTYTYDVGKGESITFTLVAVAGDPEIKDPDSSTPQPSNPSTQTPAPQMPSVSAPSTPAATAKVSVGMTVTDTKSKSVYKVAGNAVSGYIVTYVRPASKKAKSVVIPATVTVNGVSCKVTSIANNAFKGQKKLTKVTIGANVTTIGKKAFFGCKELKKVTVKSKQLKKVGAKAFARINAKAKIKMPNNKKKAYKKLFKKNTGAKASMW